MMRELMEKRLRAENAKLLSAHKEKEDRKVAAAAAAAAERKDQARTGFWDARVLLWAVLSIRDLFRICFVASNAMLTE